MLFFLIFCVGFKVSTAFDHLEFLDKYCSSEAEIKVNAEGVIEAVTNGFLCEHFVLKEDDIRYAASNFVTFSNQENVVFKYCDLGYLNEDIINLFPKAHSLYIENCRVSFKSPSFPLNNTINSPFKRISFFKSEISGNLKSTAFKKMIFLDDFFVFRSTFEYPFIDSHLLEGNQNLDWIYITHSGIKDVSKDFLKNTPNLSELHLSGNFIESVDENFLGTEISFLSLMDNKLKSLPSSLDVFYKQQSLEFINLSGNDISVDQLLRNHFRKFEKTIYLDLSRNTRMMSIGFDAFKDMARLRYLNISDSNVEHLECLGSKNLNHFDISKNKLKIVKENVFQNLTKLATLHLSENLLEIIEEGAFKDLRRLYILNISGNNLTEIKKNHFQGLGELLDLDLSENSISRIYDKSFVHLTRLENLYLQKNLLKIIPGDNLLPSTLKILNISFNPLQFLGKNTFDNLKSLKYLDLSFTNRTYYYFSKEYLMGLDNLEKLKFQGNMMKSLGYFYIPESLEKLDVSKNRLSVLLKSDFENLVNLKEVSFERNLIRTIDEGVMDKLRKLNFVDFSGNPIDKVMGRPFNKWKDCY
ncbi:IGFALS family protein [Megaselia abdita]